VPSLEILNFSEILQAFIDPPGFCWDHRNGGEENTKLVTPGIEGCSQKAFFLGFGACSPRYFKYIISISNLKICKGPEGDSKIESISVFACRKGLFVPSTSLLAAGSVFVAFFI